MIIEIFKDRNKQYRFRIKSRNGKIWAQSEGYARKWPIKTLIGRINTSILDGRAPKVKDLTL